MFVPTRKFAFSRKNIDNLKVKEAEYTAEKFANFVQNAGLATKIRSQSSQKYHKWQSEKSSNKRTKWNLPNLFLQKVVSDELLPLGYLSKIATPYPQR